jgi:predicted CopG family antitoxin
MSAATDTKREQTTLSVHQDVHARLESLKPYNSMSFNEFIVELADLYEAESDG